MKFPAPTAEGRGCRNLVMEGQFGFCDRSPEALIVDVVECLCVSNKNHNRRHCG